MPPLRQRRSSLSIKIDARERLSTGRGGERASAEFLRDSREKRPIYRGGEDDAGIGERTEATGGGTEKGDLLLRVAAAARGDDERTNERTNERASERARWAGWMAWAGGWMGG